MAGYVSVDPVRREVVFSARGSANFLNRLKDFDAFQTDCTFADGCMVHEGFSDAWASISKDVTQAIKEAMEANPDYSIALTGHSLGGAVATLAAAYLRRDGVSCDVYTYGSPRVGNEQFVQFAMSQPGKQYHITHLNDPVPQQAPTWLNYRHVSPEYGLSTGDAKTVDYSIGDVKICIGTANKDCNGGVWTNPFDLTPHVHYFEKVDACAK